MDKNKVNVPKIRFPGFDGPWEKRKLGELYEKVIEKNDLSYGEDKIISVANMYFKSEASLTNKEYLRTYNVFKLGDIAFEGNKSKNFLHGRFVENTIGDGIVSHVFDVFRPLMMQYDLSFWKYMINNESVMVKILIRSTKASTMMTNLVAKDFLNEYISIPSFQEQEKIGIFLNNLDNLITLHQRKLEHLQDKNKGLLQKMFPKEGEKFPEVRFPGFTGPWEQRKLGEIFHQTVDFINPQLSNIELWSLTVEKGLTPKTDRYDREFLVKKEDKFKIVNPNDFVYNPMNMTLGAIGYNEMDKSVAVSGYYVTMKSNNLIDDSYMKVWLKTPQAIQLYKMHATGSLIEKQRVQFPTLSEIEFRLSSIEEQQQIGKCLKNIDKLINLHQRKLEHLRQQKKGLLQQMFI